jgi:hypothetical protein
MSARWSLVAGLILGLAACASPPYDHHRPFPQVETLDGSLLSPLRLVTIVPQNDAADADAFFAFSNGVGASAWWKAAAPEYGLGTVTSAATLMGPAITSNVTDHDVFEYVEAIVATNASIAPDGHTLYLLYLPQLVEVVHDGTPNTNCDQFGAYHVRFGTRGDNLAPVQRCTEKFPVENMTVAASHEIFEAATDPDDHSYRLPAVAEDAPWTETVWNAWDLTGGAELADLCVGTYWREGPNVYQRVWSNVAARRGGDPCVPALPDPYYNTTLAEEWYAVPKGGSVDIPVTGWATGDVVWPFEPFVEGSDGPPGTVPTFTATLPGAFDEMHAGQRVNVTVSALPDTPSGTFTIVDLVSERPDVPMGARGLSDGAHLNYVGVYVP